MTEQQTPTLIPTKYRFIYAVEDKPDEEFEVQWPKDPGYDLIMTVVEQIFPRHTSEHVSVLYNNQPCDMFVDETGHWKKLPRNNKATDIYRANWLKQHPTAHPETLSHIVGDVILFERRIWY